MARSLYRYRYDYLIGKGFLDSEAREFAKQYTMQQMRTTPYLQNLIRWRGLYVSGLRKRGLTNKQIIDRLRKLYIDRGWEKDPWKMLKDFRKKAIDEGEYKPPPHKGSHHPKGSGWSVGDRKAQKSRRKSKHLEDIREEYNAKIIKAIQAGDQKERARLERARDKALGYS
ncbi:MAG: hypothetical protein PHQ86_07940 [Dehalococcoidales bacterium]|nr:hypothetical protein [Dehalococcoidales bacterium]